MTSEEEVFALACPVCQTSLGLFDGQAATSHVNRCLDGPLNTPSEASSGHKSLNALPNDTHTPIHPLFAAAQNKRKLPPQIVPKLAKSKRKPAPSKPAIAVRKPSEPQPPLGRIRDLPVALLGPIPPLLAQPEVEAQSPEPDLQPAIPNHSDPIKHPEVAAPAGPISNLAEIETHSESSTTLSIPPFRSKRECPWYKKLPHTGFTIDAFCHGAIAGCTAYFLTHFHSDHYGGLTSKFNAGPIYCSKVTANLVRSQLRVAEEWIHVLPMETPVEVQGVQVTLIDANHCPGAVLFVFRVPGVNHVHHHHLHTGDFRAISPFHTTHRILLDTRFKSLYLDTTYCDMRYAFPPQERVLGVVRELVVEVVKKGRKVEDVVAVKGDEGGRNMMRQFLQMGSAVVDAAVGKAGLMGNGGSAKKGTVVCVGTYTIGKERVFMTIARALNSKIYADATKRRVLKCLEDPELDALLTSNPLEAIVHIVKMGHLNKEELEKKLTSFSRVMAIRPTGWTYRQAKDGTPSAEFSIQSINPTRLAHNIHVIPIPYSEHSSFTELEAFVKAIKVEQVIPTVNVGRHEEMQALFNSWRK
ncbi:DNA break repair nuclease [Podochytrium sp. JEL0797]|nr:DNA break repair nuclease [Podochytrium sp. JEL0797]